MVKKRIHVDGAKILILGLTFKENCPDIRNTLVVDIIEELEEYNIAVDIYDPWCSSNEAKDEYDIDLINEPTFNTYDGIILAVGHTQFKELGASVIHQYGKSDHVLYDLKYIFNKQDVDIRL